jgi:hypothetical protein
VDFGPDFFDQPQRRTSIAFIPFKVKRRPQAFAAPVNC